MTIRFYNAKILTMNNDCSVIHGELWTNNDEISFVGTPARELPIFSKEIDCEGNLLMPGFKNAHSHSPMVFLRSYADDLPLLDWLHKMVLPAETKLTPEDGYNLTKLAILEYLSSGITSTFDMYLFPYEIAKASSEMGFRNVLCGALNSFTHSLAELDEQYAVLNHFHPLISMNLGFHAEYTTDIKLIEGVAKLSQKYKTPVFTHLAESKGETDQCIDRTGKTPTAYLNQLGIWEYGGGGFHCVHMSDDDLQIFKDKGLFAVTNPGSNVKLASGTPKLTQMQKLGIPIALGTDGAASNNALDFFWEMRLATALQKLSENNASAMPAENILYMATVGGAKTMGLSNCDNLSVGKQADIIMLNLKQPNMQPVNNLVKNIVYSGSKSNIKMTMVAGKMLFMDNQYFVSENPEDIYAKAQKIADRIIG